MKILHICWGLDNANGAANIARLIIGEQQSAGHDATLVSKPSWRQLHAADQIWCHCGWYWMFWLVSLYKRFSLPQSLISSRQPFLWRMTECCYDPIRLKFHGWKKWLVGPIERWSMQQCDVLIATCEAEAEWIRNYVGKKCPKVEVTDVKRFFKLNRSEEWRRKRCDGVNILYLGRPHPLKGTKYLEQAVKELNNSPHRQCDLRFISNHSGDELERDWEWCDVLCLPTLSDNFGLVIAEALERGKMVVTTDGASAWEDFASPRLIYLRGYRDGSEKVRVSLLKDAFKRLLDGAPQAGTH